jgi:hypothetical protein
VEIKDIDRSKNARERRWREYLQLKILPHRTKEQEGRFAWLKMQRERDNRIAMEQAK